MIRPRFAVLRRLPERRTDTSAHVPVIPQVRPVLALLAIGNNSRCSGKRLTGFLQESEIGQFGPQGPAVIRQPVRDHAEERDRLVCSRCDLIHGTQIGFLAFGAGRARQFFLQQQAGRCPDRASRCFDCPQICVLAGQRGKSGIQRIADDRARRHQRFQFRSGSAGRAAQNAIPAIAAISSSMPRKPPEKVIAPSPDSRGGTAHARHIPAISTAASRLRGADHACRPRDGIERLHRAGEPAGMRKRGRAADIRGTELHNHDRFAGGAALCAGRQEASGSCTDSR